MATVIALAGTPSRLVAERAVPGDGVAAPPPPRTASMKRLAMPSQLADNSTCVGHGLSDASLLLARDAIPLSSRYSDSRSGITSESTAFSFIYQ